ncbi:MAG TPA: RNase adapter RapZ [Methylomirabilota bacterium]|jgi:aminoglycoside/choline kinase family phosphotransferase|nr:RNase adapter RapZ [Methylomirabilota bacterium]
METVEAALKRLFEGRFAEPVRAVAPLKSDGSARRLFRLSGETSSAIGVHGPDARENRAFLAFSRQFRTVGLSVPEIYAEEPARGVYLEEDLGDTTLFEFLSANRSRDKLDPPVVDIYRQTVRVLPRFQIVAHRALDYGLCHPRSSFDRQSMMWDLNYFKYYFLRLAKVPFNEQALEDDFQRFTEFLLEAPGDYFLYRDFQSRNVMVRGGRPWFIDYQGGRRGALQYDIASLLFDAKADLPFDLRQELLGLYLETAGALAPLDRQAFLTYYPAFVLIRIMQALGAYGLRGFYEGKSHFLQSIPYAIRNLEYLVRTTELPVELPELSAVFKRLVAASTLRKFGDASLKLTVRVQSFSYRSGVPTDEKGHGGGYVFDCRALPNPGQFERFSRVDGRNPDVIAFLEQEPAVQRFLAHVYGLVDQAVETYQSRNFTDLLVAFGCTGGHHRSIYCAEELARHLRERYDVDVEVRHLEAERADGSGAG